MSSVPEGWYVDPSTGTNLRWWSGTTWTDEVAPLPHEPTHSGPLDLFAAMADRTLSTRSTEQAEPSAEQVEPAEPAEQAEPSAEPAEPAEASAEPAEPAEASAEPAESSVEPAEAAPEAPSDLAPDDTEQPEASTELPAAAAAQPTESTDLPIAVLDPEIELTLLTRRELRARRGAEVIPNDCPKHLPPVTSVAAVPLEQWQEPLEELEIPALPVEQPVDVPEADHGRRRRIVRLSVLLGILAVATSVAVLTAGTL